MEEPNHLDVDLETRIPVINKVDGTLLVGEDAPRRAELEMWLQGHPEFAVDPRFLAVSVSSIQQDLKSFPWYLSCVRRRKHATLCHHFFICQVRITVPSLPNSQSKLNTRQIFTVELLSNHLILGREISLIAVFHQD